MNEQPNTPTPNISTSQTTVLDTVELFNRLFENLQDLPAELEKGFREAEKMAEETAKRIRRGAKRTDGRVV